MRCGRVAALAIVPRPHGSMTTTITPDLIRAALAHIPPTLQRDDWARVGMAIQSEFPDDTGLGLFTDWSATAEGFNVGEVRSTWRSFKAGAVKIGTLLRLAKERDTLSVVADQIGNPTYAGDLAQAIIEALQLPTFPNGFPEELIQEFEAKTGHKVLCNLPYSGTEVLKDYGEQAMKENALIVYTSADSVFQVAAHEELVPVHELYRYCEIAREMLKGAYGVGRVIARPFLGSSAETFYRTTNRHDLSLKPPRATMLDLLKEDRKSVV